MMSVTVAALVGYVITVDNLIRHPLRRSADEAADDAADRAADTLAEPDHPTTPER